MSQSVEKSLMDAPCGSLPTGMRILYISSRRRTGGWLAEGFAGDSACRVLLEEAPGVTAGMTRLRDEVFDAVLLSHEPGELDSLEFLEGARAGGTEDPIIVLGNQSEEELAALCYETGADAYLRVASTTVRHLIWVVARAVEQRQLIRENRRHTQSQRRRLQQEHNEAGRLLAQQRALIRDLEALRSSSAPIREIDANLKAASQNGSHQHGQENVTEKPWALPPQLVAFYREMLRAHVMMGSGNLATEMSTLAELLSGGGITPRQAMQLHVVALEELVRGLGSRGSRHVMSRAELLVLEVMMHLAESYRQRYEQNAAPRRQQSLPGFESVNDAQQ